MKTQLTLFNEPNTMPLDLKASRSGTFVDNMVLPVHRWFRYSAGFAAQWVEQVLSELKIGDSHIVLDPFAGSGTVPVVCDTLGIKSIGVEAHPIVARICKAKLLWITPVERFANFASQVLRGARNRKLKTYEHPPLIQRSFDEHALTVLDSIKESWLSSHDKSSESELVWLALTSILRPTSKAGTAQWQYILPNKTKKMVLQPFFAFEQQIEVMKSDMRWMQRRVIQSHAQIIA